MRGVARSQRLQKRPQTLERKREGWILHVGPRIPVAAALVVVARSPLLLGVLELGGILEVCMQEVGLAMLPIVDEVAGGVHGGG